MQNNPNSNTGYTGYNGGNFINGNNGNNGYNGNIPTPNQMNSFPPMPFPQFPFPPGMPFPPPFPNLPSGGPFPPFPPHILGPQPPISPQIPSGLTSAAAPVEVGQPNRSLYLQNLPEKPNPQKHLPPLLKDLFSAFGPLKRPPILRKGVAMNGQAWIVFKEQADADRAIKSLQGTRIWGKSLVIRYARFRSDCVIREESGNLEAERKIRETDRIERSKTARVTRRQLLTRLMSGNPSALQSVSISGPDVLLPNRTLFIQNIPPGMSSSPILSNLFRRHPGFQDLRPVPNRPDVAFVEYETEAQAGVARQSLDRTDLGSGNVLRVSFARR